MDISEEVRTLKFISEVDKNNGMVMHLYDHCESKMQYRRLVNICEGNLSAFRNSRRKSIKKCMVTEHTINDDLVIRSTICNFDPNYIGKQDHPLEITVEFKFGNNESISAKGSSYFGGCNYVEYKEFVSILKKGIHDFTKENIEND